MEQKECRNCPSSDGSNGEWYSFMGISFDVKKAKQLIAARKDKTPGRVSRKSIEGIGFELEPVDRTKGSFKISLFGHNDEHLAHIPADKLDEPIIFAKLVFESNREKESARKVKQAIDALYSVSECADIVKELTAIHVKLKEQSSKRRTSDVLIDGTHRVIRRYREGAQEFPAYMLTPEESLQCITNVSPDSFKRMGLYTVERKKLAKKGRAA